MRIIRMATAVLFATTTAAMMTAPSAFGASGDRVINHTNTSAIIATNQCPEAVLTSILRGAAGKLDYVMTTQTAAGNTHCYMRSRIVYNPVGTSRILYSGWTYSQNRKTEINAVNTGGEFYRCRYDVQLRRNDGSWFGIQVKPTTRFGAC